MAFAIPAFAADVKFSGSYIIQGYYEDNRAIAKNYPLPDGSNEAGSLSNMWQRLRLQTDFQVAEGLKLTTRADIMEKIWGATRGSATAPTSSVGNNSEADNIHFDHVYVSFNTAIGLIRTGYMAQTAFGTDFGNSADQTYGPRIAWSYDAGPLTVGVIYDKYEASKAYNSVGPAQISAATISSAGVASFSAGASTDADKDKEKISPYFIYKFTGGETGLLLQYRWDSTKSAVADGNYKGEWYVVNPYFKGKFGSVYAEGEFAWVYGHDRKYETAAGGYKDVDRSGYQLYLMANVDLAPAYVGAAIVWVRGTDTKKNDKNSAAEGGGTDFNPCLILYNYDLARWNGGLGGLLGSGGIGTSLVTYNTSDGKTGLAYSPGARAVQVFAGVKPIPKLDVKLSYTYAQADEVPYLAGVKVDREVGHEIDLTATYKIYDNLSYMIGGGYFIAGDIWKLGDPNTKVENDYLITHKLTLTF